LNGLRVETLPGKISSIHATWKGSLGALVPGLWERDWNCLRERLIAERTLSRN